MATVPQCMGRVNLSTKRGRAVWNGYNGKFSEMIQTKQERRKNKKKKKCRGGSEQETEHDEVSHGVQHEETLLNDEADAKKPDNNQVCNKSVATKKIVRPLRDERTREIVSQFSESCPAASSPSDL